MTWHVRPGEDVLLWTYWMRSDINGRLWREVHLPKGEVRSRKNRYFDALIAPGGPAEDRGRQVPWQELGDSAVQVIEVKSRLDEDSIGQVAVAREAVASVLARSWTTVDAVIVVGEVPDETLMVACDELSIDVVQMTAAATPVVACLQSDDPLISALVALQETDGLPTLGDAVIEAARRQLLT